jgi:hypothetical protein
MIEGVDWRDAYKRRADYLTATIGLDKAAEKASLEESKKSSELANAAFRASIKNSPAVTLSTPVANNGSGNSELDERIKKGGWDGFLASAEETLQQPVVKGILDALSIGTYTSAALANSGVEIAKEEKAHGSGAALGKMLDETVNHNPIVMGVKAAFGDEDSRRTYGDVIKNVQGMRGEDTESDQAKLEQGIGGFIGDVALDPTTYITVGGTAIAKGLATGAREGMSGAKRVAADALRAAEAEGGSLAGTRLERIANNPKGVIGTAIEQAKNNHGAWKDKRAAEHNARVDKWSKRIGPVSSLDKETGTVGHDIREFQAGIDARLAEQTAKEAEIALSKIERDAKLREEEYLNSLKTPEENLAEAQADVAGEVPVAETGVKSEDDIAPPVAPPTKEEINSTDIKTEVDESRREVPVVSEVVETPKHHEVIARNGPVVDKFEPRWIKPKYGDARTGVRKGLYKALDEPSHIDEIVPYTKWDKVYEDFKKSPNTMVLVDGQKQKAGDLVKLVDSKMGKGDPNVLGELGIHPAFTQAHTSTMREVPNGKTPTIPTERKKGMGEWTGKGAEGKDKKKAQKVAGKVRKSKDEADRPKQEDFYKSDDPMDAMDFAESDDLEKFIEYADANPDEVLKIVDPATGRPHEAKIGDLAKIAHSGSKGFGKFYSGNPIFFAQFDETADAAKLAKAKEEYQKAVDEFEGTGDEVADAVDEPELVDNAVEEADEILPETGFDLIPNYEPRPNPNVWTSEKAKQFALDPEDHHLTPNEIRALTTEMKPADIRAFIKAKEGGISKGELDELRAFTGKTDAAEVADEFIKMRKAYKDAKDKLAKEKPAPPTRLDEVNDVLDEIGATPIKATPADIENAQQEAASIANEIAKSPVALDEVAQQEFRVQEYDRSLKAELPEALNGVISREHVNDIARQAVKASIAEQTKEAQFITGIEKMRTNTREVDTGGAWRPDRWGSNSMVAMHKVIWQEATALKVPTGHVLSTRRKAYMAMMDVAVKELRAMGVEPFLNQVTQQVGKKGINHAANLSYYDILKALHGADFGGVLDIMVTGTRAFVPTQVQGATETIVRLRASGVSEEVIRQRAIKQLVGSRKDTEKFGRPENNAKAVDSFTRGRIDAMRNVKKGETLPMMTAIRGRVKDARKVVDALMDPRTYKELNVQMLVNHAAHASTLGKKVEDLTEGVVKRMLDLKDSGSSGDILGYLRGEIKSMSEKFSEQDINTAKELFHARMQEHTTKAEELSFIEATKRAESTKPPAPVAKEKMEAQAKINDDGKPAHESFHKEQPKPQPKQADITKSHVKEVDAAEKQAMEMAPEGAEDFEVIAASIANAAMRKIHPFQKFVNPRLGLTDDVYRAVNSGLHSIARQQSEFHGSLLTHLAKYGDEALINDFKELQRLARESGISKNDINMLPLGSSESMKELYGIVSIMLDRSAYNVFARNGIGANHFNTLAKANGLHETWRFEHGVDAATNSTLWMNWQGIEERGVLDFLSRMHSIAIKASQDIAIAASFSKNFGKTAPGPGLVKVTWKNRKSTEQGSAFYDLIDHDLYYPKEIAMQVTQIDNLMRESRHIDPKGPIGKFIVNVYDPITNALKASQTTVRPGHWMVSISGDLFRNQLAGVNTIAPYKHAARILRAGKKLQQGSTETDKMLESIGSAKSLRSYAASQEINQGFVGTSNGRGLVLIIGGKKRNVDYETMNKIVRDVIALPKHRGGGVIEDRFVDTSPTAGFAKGIEKVTDFITDNEKFSLNEMAATRDNLMRIALAVDFASKRKWKNLQEMKDAMEEQVTKWAPTSTDLTAWESKYSRRALLYYTWLRGITPRIADMAMTKPGVTTMVPKAMYNLAFANGLNPESIGNPFPEEGGLFPDYYANNVLGPQWKDDYGMWGINPGSPVAEVANTFSKFKAGDPLGNIKGGIGQAVSMSNPFIRMPFETATGHQAGTEIPIKDQGQYMLDNLGGSYAATLSRATGKTAGFDGILDRTDSAAKATPEDQAEHAKLQLFNFLSGLKLTDYASESAQKAASYDLRQKYQDEAKLQERR